RTSSPYLKAVLALVLYGCASARVALHDSAAQPPACRLAILPIKGDDPFVGDLADALTTELVNAGYQVMERTELRQILKEQAFEYSGALDANATTQIGRLSGVDYVVLGSISTKPVTPTLEWLLGDGRSEFRIDGVNLRWVNVQSGQVVASIS